MMQECAAKWRNMSTEDKTPYQAMADVDKERWQTEKAAEKKPKDQWRPKRPPSAYFLFLRDFRENWKSEHEDELNQPVPDPKPASEETKSDTTVADEAAKTTENSNKEETKSEVVSDGESALQIDESASNNNKPQLPSGDQTAAKAVKKDKPIRKTSRVVVRPLIRGKPDNLNGRPNYYNIIALYFTHYLLGEFLLATSAVKI